MTAGLCMLLALAVSAPALACSFRPGPNDQQFLMGARPPSLLDGGSDEVAPSATSVSDVRLELVDANACTGEDLECPEGDGLVFTVLAADDQTPPGRLRYVAWFGRRDVEVTDSLLPQLIFRANEGAPDTVGAWLGVRGARSERGFSARQLCFAVAAVDEAGNVGARSSATCLDTTDPATPVATSVSGSCPPRGCGCRSGPDLIFAWLALLFLSARRQGARQPRTRQRQAPSRGSRFTWQ